MGLTPSMIQTRHLMHNPGKLYIGTNPDADGRITLASDGSPESVANPNAIYFGATAGGAEFMDSRTTVPVECDEEDGAIDEFLTKRAAAMSLEILELGDYKRLQKVMPGTKYYEDDDVIEISAGGLYTLTLIPVTLIAPRKEDPTKFAVWQLMRAFNSAEFKCAVSGKAFAKTPLKFEARNDPARPAGERLFKMWKQKIASEVAP